MSIRVEGLSKQYRIGGKQERYKTLRDTLTDAAFSPFRKLRALTARNGHSNGQSENRNSASDIIWALKDITFEVKRGEVFGIIGRNGAGKSTLLKILSRITEPTEGYADIHGRVGSLLEVGTGFHPELTGRENIYLNGSILGMKRVEIDRRFDEIVSFAEIDDFIDTPVKHYSSGMYLRLAFAVAAHLETEILLVDEVLAVGDAAFQRKCLGKMRDVGATGRTVLFVSHDLTAIARLAPQTILLRSGAVAFCGSTDDAIRYYISEQQLETGDLATRKDRTGDGVIRMMSIRITDFQERLTDAVGSGDAIRIAISYITQLRNLQADEVILDVRLTDVLGHPITTLSTRFSKFEGPLDSNGVLVCQIPSLALAEETYGIDLWLAYRGALADYVERAGELRVVMADYYGTGHEPVKRKHGAALINHSWGVQESSGRALRQVSRVEARVV